VSVVANVAINIDGKQAQSLLKAIQSEVEKLNGEFDQVSKKTSGLFDQLNSAATSAVGQLVAVTGAAFTLQKVFDTLGAQSKADAALRSLNVNTEQASVAFRQLSSDLSGQASQVELTTAAYDVASAGFANVADQTRILEAATKGAVGGMSDVNTVGNAVTSVLNAYGMSAGQASTLVDQFIQTQNDGKIILAEYASQIGNLAPTAKAAGVGIDELNAAISTITAQGVPVESTFTGLNQALIAILKPSQEAADLAKQLGIDFSESGLRAKGFGGLLADVAKATGGSTTAITKLFGSVDALKAVLPLISGDLASFNKNLENQRNSAGVATKAFDDMRNTMEGALKEVQTAFENLIVAFAPALPAIIAPFKLLAGTISLVANNLKAVSQAAVFLATFSGILNASVIATKAWAVATQGLAAAKKAAGVAAAFLQAVMNPANIAKIALALGAATGAAVLLGKSMENSANQIAKTKGSQDGVTKAAAESVKQYSSLPKPIEDSKEAAKKLKEEQQAITDAIQESGKQIEANAKMNQAIADQHSSFRQAYLKAEMQINDVLLDQAKTQLDNAKTQEQRIKAARDIYDLTVKQAQLEYEATKAQIAAETEKANLALMAADQKAKEVQIIVQLAAAQGKVNDSHYKALQLANEAVDLAGVQSATVKLVAQQQERAAQAALQGKINAADSAFQANILAKNTSGAASAAAQFAGQMERGAVAAIAAARGIGVVRTLEDMQTSIGTLSGSTTTTASYTAEEAKALGIGPYANANRGGESEYVIPQSRQGGFAASYLPGTGSAAALPSGNDGSGAAPAINIQTGPVMQQGGTNYVTVKDFEQGLQSVAASLLGNNRSTGGRRYAGVR
jgi:TP901 family phage tail tape measure protein